MPMLKTKSAMTITAERPPRRGASRPTARIRRGADALEVALLARLPGAPAAHAPPPSSPHAPVRTARPPALCKAVCALSPTELMARGARQPHTARRAHSR